MERVSGLEKTSVKPNASLDMASYFFQSAMNSTLLALAPCLLYWGVRHSAGSEVCSTSSPSGLCPHLTSSQVPNERSATDWASASVAMSLPGSITEYVM